MTNAEKKFAAEFCFGAATALSVLAFKLWYEGKKIDKRMKRAAAFISESEALNAKHADAGTLYTKTHSDELIDLMNRHGQ